MRIFGLLSVIFIFLLLNGITSAVFLTTVLPYGWPKNSFMLCVPLQKQSALFALIGVVFMTPNLISCFMYTLLYYKVEVRSSKVGVEIPKDPKPEVQFGGIFVGKVTNSSVSSTSGSVSSERFAFASD